MLPYLVVTTFVAIIIIIIIIIIWGTFEQHYDQWKDVVTLERPLIFPDTPTAYTVVDDLLPKELKKPLDFRTFLCVAQADDLRGEIQHGTRFSP